ncbi:MAG: dockerin type I repeat-containing protein [Bacteroidales bacterium]|nr:dockerin type I repeat-containing protein [Bacteroidales bacterium]
MKKTLLISAAILATSAIAAQAEGRMSDRKLQPADPARSTDVIEIATADFAVEKTAHNQYVKKKAVRTKADMGRAWYHRPAGVYYGTFVQKDEDLVSKPYSYSSMYAPYLHGSAYSKITYVNASTEATEWEWQSHQYDRDAKGYIWVTSTERDLVRDCNLERDTVPVFTANYGGVQSSYQIQGGKLTSDKKEVEKFYTTRLLTYQDYENAFSNTATNHLWWTPKFFAASTNRDASKLAGAYYKTGAKDKDGGTTGRWFGRNFSGVDGMAMAFEKPDHAYALRRVGVRFQGFKTTAPVTLQANVYRLESVPAFDEEQSVYAEPMELLASGTATVDFPNATNGIIAFPLQVEEDGIVFDVVVNVDYPILVEVTGYNVDEVEDFTMLYSSDTYDEGHGELCYAKRLQQDGTYAFQGMNNFFTSGQLFCGVSIMADIERPFMTYNRFSETGEHELPVEGGEVDIEVFTNHPGDEWAITDVNDEEVPEWLSVSYEDDLSRKVTTVHFEAAPLPEGVSGRQCVVKSMVPGTSLLYTIKQGEVKGVKGDVNGDGEVNVSDVTALVNKILGTAEYADEVSDINEDGEVNVSDVTALINLILGA